MRVHLHFGVGEMLIVALRHSTTRLTCRLYRQDRIVSVTLHNDASPLTGANGASPTK